LTYPLAPSSSPSSVVPKSTADKIRWLQLIRSRRVGPATFQRLLGEFGSAEAALAELPRVAQDAGVARYKPFSFENAKKEYEAGIAAGADLICLGTAEYPANLPDIADAPPVLWVRGDLRGCLRPTMSMVGARNASSLGTRMAKLLARDLGQAGYTIVSGLARGIDTASHLAALATGTIAVMAGGIDQIYPQENAELAEKITESGCLISEQPVGLSPQARHFPRRNRLISGLSLGVIVVECAARSGSLITARDALDQGREVMAVPGHPMDARAAGCNMLIRDGATLVRGARDVMAIFDTPETPADQIETASLPPKPRPTGLSDALALSRRILSLLGPSPVAENQLIRDLDVPAQTVSTQLVDLELQGKLIRQTGGMLSVTA